MKLLCICITWNRPTLLGRTIHCFLQQTDPDARLFILDDAGQYRSHEHDRWTLFSTPTRYPSMGEKRNALLDMATVRYPEVEGFMLWDDDDVYFPHAAASVSFALDQKPWAQPTLTLELSSSGKSLKRVETIGGRRNHTDIAYGGCWAWRLDAFAELGRFQATNHSEDTKAAWPSQELFGPSANSSPDEPWYYYCRSPNQIAQQGKNFYDIRGSQKIEFVGDPTIGWNGPDIYQYPIEPGIHPRPW